jgi:hypothetical protein
MSSFNAVTCAIIGENLLRVFSYTGMLFWATIMFLGISSVFNFFKKLKK